MKYAYTGREGIKNNSLSIKSKKGSFLDRFKGKTTQMGKEGHLGKAKTYSVMPNNILYYCLL